MRGSDNAVVVLLIVVPQHPTARLLVGRWRGDSLHQMLVRWSWIPARHVGIAGGAFLGARLLRPEAAVAWVSRDAVSHIHLPSYAQPWIMQELLLGVESNVAMTVT